MLPHPQYTPARAPQSVRHNSIARFVCGQLATPEFPVVLRFGRVLRAAMPETAVHKHRELELLKNEVRLAEDFLITPPASDAIRPENFCQRQFRVLVSSSGNPRHHFRPLRFSENIRHFNHEIHELHESQSATKEHKGRKGFLPLRLDRGEG